MALRVVGAGLGRTGTHSIKLAVEELLGGRCYHMSEAIEKPGDTAAWKAALREEHVGWGPLLADYVATVDWPACAFWRELSSINPEAIVLLSTRASAAEWWASFEQTILVTLSEPVPPGEPDWAERREMTLGLMERFDPAWRRREAAMAAYERHNDAVRAAVPGDRLVEWRTGDGWAPICAALGLRVPSKPFPHTNTAAEFRRERVGVAGGERRSSTFATA
jgi:sulfotransferase family protein